MPDLLDLPLTVAGLVMPVVVDSPDLDSSRRSRSHVIEEVAEIEPSFTDSYTLASIAGIRCIPFVEASRHHPVPGRSRAGVICSDPGAVSSSRKLLLHLLLCQFGQSCFGFLGVMSS